MRWIFNEYFLENQNILFIISIIVLLILTIIPFVIAYKILKRENVD